MRKLKAEQVFVLFCTLLFFAAFVNRLFYGIETSDEAFYCATGYRLMKGNIPFGDMWEPNAANSFIMAPFLFARSFLVTDGEGIQLYLRLCFLVPSVFAAYSVYKYARTSLKKEYSFLLGLLILFYAPFQVFNFSYNNMLNVFMTISICMFLLAIHKQSKIYCYFSGLAMALAVLAYPTVIYICVFLLVLFLILKPLRQGLLFSYYYSLGGLTLALPIVIYLLYFVGIDALIKNLSFILTADSAHSVSISYILKKILDALVYLKTPFVENGNFFSLYWFMLIALSMFKRTKTYAKFLVIFFPLLCCNCSLYGVTRVKTVMRLIFSLSVVAPVVLLLSDNKLETIKRFLLEWGMAILLYFTLAFSSGGGERQAIHGLILATIISTKLLLEVLCSEPLIRYHKLVSYVLIAGIIGCEIFAFYSGTYREAPYEKLTAKVEQGVYKGLFTTPERKKHITDLESVMKKIEEKDETVMILYHSCYAYLMTDMLAKIPSTWGAYDFKAYKFDNQNMFLEYLKHKDNIPRNIYIVDIPKKFDFARQKTEYYKPFYPKLNKFIENHYKLIGTYEEGLSGKVTKYKVDDTSF
ncbi:MAG: glycosyltransferase family 39 protein [Alphaproteobacteria bacterium]|nr:glycosyltransferase family 39 protein [Alphaproteobacteria bacterium]